MAARETDSPGLEALEESIGQDEAAVRERHDALVADPKAAVEMAAKAELRSKQIREGGGYIEGPTQRASCGVQAR